MQVWLSGMKTYADKRVSFTFYDEDLKALRRLRLALRDLKADVELTDTLRLLLFACSEAELFAHAALALEQEAKGPRPSKGTAETRFSVTVPQDFIDKLGHVRDDLSRKDLDTERTFIVRAVLHASHDVKALLKALPKMEQAYPDKRSFKGQRRG